MSVFLLHCVMFLCCIITACPYCTLMYLKASSQSYQIILHCYAVTLILVDLIVVHYSVWINWLFGVVALDGPRTVVQQLTVSGWKFCRRCPVGAVSAKCRHLCCGFWEKASWGSSCCYVPVKTRWACQRTARVSYALAYDRLVQNDIWPGLPRMPVVF